MGILELVQRIQVLKAALAEIDRMRYQRTELPKFMSRSKLWGGSLPKIPEGRDM